MFRIYSKSGTALICVVTVAAFATNNIQLLPLSQNESGTSASSTTDNGNQATNAFFRSLGTNGRACVDCHQASAGWTITPTQIRQLFDRTEGLAPLFRLNDGANSPRSDVSDLAKRRSAYSMLLNKGLIRVGLPIPAGADFELVEVDDPYGFASASELSLFRRPLPSTNLRFLSAVMWDGRETATQIKGINDLVSNLKAQVIDATLGHAEAKHSPTDQDIEQIVHFELGLHTAQIADSAGGTLLAREATGGPIALSQQDFFIGINDPLGGNPTGASFNPEAMTLFSSWRNLSGPSSDPLDVGDRQSRNTARQAVERGQRLFNTRTIAISGVRGLNDALNVPVLQGTCTTCHDAPNVGNHSVPLAIDIGLTDESRRSPDMPLYTLRRKKGREIIRTTDPGRALITGKWVDIGKFKGPVLRGLAARAPYFHNGSAATLFDAVEFYNTRFRMDLSGGEREDLIAFLRSL
jgi:cytochrome c peroxidase